MFSRLASTKGVTLKFGWFLMFLPVAVAVMLSAPGTGWAAAAFVLLIGMWCKVIWDRESRKRKAPRR
jgi:hypothetical protein